MTGFTVFLFLSKLSDFTTSRTSVLVCATPSKIKTVPILKILCLPPDLNLP